MLRGGERVANAPRQNAGIPPTFRLISAFNAMIIVYDKRNEYFVSDKNTTMRMRGDIDYVVGANADMLLCY